MLLPWFTLSTKVNRCRSNTKWTALYIAWSQVSIAFTALIVKRRLRPKASFLQSAEINHHQRDSRAFIKIVPRSIHPQAVALCSTNVLKVAWYAARSPTLVTH